MKVRTEDREGLFKALVVEVEGNLVRTALDEVYDYLKKNVEIHGFRKGNAPLWLIRAKYKDYIQEEVGKKVANKTLEEAIKESKLKPVADVFLEKVQLEEEKEKLTYTVSFEVPPKFELKEIEGMEVEVPKVEFSEELVEKRIEQLREEHAVWKPVDREIRDGDLVTVDYEVEEVGGEGEKVKGETSGIIGMKMFREELEKALKGKKKEEEVFLENLPIFDQQGKEIGRANVKVKVKEVKEKVLPEVGDEFAKELGYENWEKARKKIEEEVKRDFERMKQAIIEDAVAKKLVSEHDIEIPKTLLRRELSFLVERRVSELRQYGVDTRYLDYKSMAEELTPEAVFNIKLRYILEAYAEKTGLEVTEEDVKEQIEELARETGSSEEEIRERFEKENLMEVIRMDALRRKALRDIVGKVKIKEVEKDEGGS